MPMEDTTWMHYKLSNYSINPISTEHGGVLVFLPLVYFLWWRSKLLSSFATPCVGGAWVGVACTFMHNYMGSVIRPSLIQHLDYGNINDIHYILCVH